MAGSFPVHRLGKYAAIQGGFAFKSSDFRCSGVGVLKIKNIRLRDVDVSELECVGLDLAKEARQYFCKFGDILVSMTGSGPQAPNSVVGRVARFTGSSDTYLFNQRVGRILIKDPRRLDGRFLFYVLTQPEYQQHLVSIATGSANQVNISGGQIENLEILLPPPIAQRAITHILGTLDDKIELNRQINKTLEEMAQAIFKNWFIDFEPVSAKAEGRDPGLPKEIADLFPDSFEDSELGPAPKGWAVKCVGDLLELAYGKPLKEQDRMPGTVPVYGSNGLIGYHDRRLVSGPGLVVGRKGNPGTVEWVPQDFFAIDTTFYVVPKTETPCLHFLFYMLRDRDLPSLSADSAVPGLNRNAAYGKECVIPPAGIIEAFGDRVKPLFDAIYRNKSQSDSLSCLRDALLPKLLSGEMPPTQLEEYLQQLPGAESLERRLRSNGRY
jgi:type I restriction enzyme, S subunit